MGHIDEMVPTPIRKPGTRTVDGAAPTRPAARLRRHRAGLQRGNAPCLPVRGRADYTELLMPDDLLAQFHLAYTREAMTPDACQDVEVVGWLYQFYISEKKDEVSKG